MKIATIILLLINSLLYYSVHSSQLQLTIGALFNDDNYETEMAFKYAIARHNMYNNRIKFKTNIQKVSKIDTFSTSKILCNMTSSQDGLIAIFGPQSLITGAMAESVCANMEIPHIQIAWNPNVPYSHQTVLNVFPDQDLLSKGIATLVKHLHWQQYAIIYETTDGLIRLQEVLKLVNINDDPVLVRQLGEGFDQRPLLKEIRNSTASQIILDCSTDKIIEILRQAKEVNLLNYFHSYLITSLDAHTLDYSVLNTTANITVVRLTDPDNPVLNNAVLDWEQGESNDNRFVAISTNKVKAESALMHDAVNFFTTIINELHATEPIFPEPISCYENRKFSSGFRISTYMKIRHYLNSITGPIKFNDYGRRIDFLLQVVEIIDGRAEKIATWSPLYPNTLNFTRSANEQLQQIVENLQKTTVIVSSRIGAPYLMEVKPKEGEILTGNDRYEGYSKDLIYYISKELNFTFRIELAADGKYGNYDEKTKSWNGLIKDLLDRKAHLAICDLTITHERRAVVDFSSPFMTLGISILYRKPAKQDANKFAFLDPFSIEVWVYTMSLQLGVAFACYLIARMAPGDWENPHPCEQNPEELENIWDFKNSLWITLGSIMAQGCDILPKGVSTRWVVSVWWFFSLIMTASYTANLAAFLTMDRMAPTIDSAEALVKQTKIKYGTVEGGSTQTFFKKSNYTTFARMWVNMQATRPSVFEKSNAEGVKRVLTTKNQLYTFLMESSSIEYEVQKNCKLKQVGRRLDSKGYGIAMPMNSPYRSAINKAVLMLQEGGKLNELKNKWWKEKVVVEEHCEADGESSGSRLALSNVGGVFIVLFMGIGVAFFIAFLDFLWNVRRVAVAEHLSYCEAMIVEVKFAVKVWNTKKRVKPDLSESSNSSSSTSRDQSESRSVAHRILKTTGSFLTLDKDDKKD